MSNLTYFVRIMNNRHKIIKVHIAFPKVWGNFSKKAFHEKTNIFGQKNYGEVVLNWGTNDQTMPRWQRIFINDKCKLTPETGGWIWKTPFPLCLWEKVGISCKSCGLGVGGNYVCCLVIVVIFMELEGAKR